MPRADGLAIRVARIDEAPVILRIMKEAFAEYRTWLDPPSGVERESLNDVVAAIGRGGAVLAFIGEQPVGTARYELRAEKFYVGRLGVLPKFRHHGIGREIMLFMETLARQRGYGTMELITRSVLTENIAFYRRLGYDREWEVDHPKAGRATIMEKDLKDPT